MKSYESFSWRVRSIERLLPLIGMWILRYWWILWKTTPDSGLNESMLHWIHFQSGWSPSGPSFWKELAVWNPKWKQSTSQYSLTPMSKQHSTICMISMFVVSADKASNNLILVCKYYYISCLAKRTRLAWWPRKPYLYIIQFFERRNTSQSCFCIAIFQKYRLMIRIRTYLVCIWFQNFTRILISSALLLARLVAQPSHYQNSSLSFSVPLNQDYSRTVTLCTPEVELTGMWILKNSRKASVLWTTFNIRFPKQEMPTSILIYGSFDFSTLYTTIPHSKLKERLRSLIMRAFFNKKGQRRYKYMVVNNYFGAYFVKNTTKAKMKYTEDEIVRMIEFPGWQYLCWVRSQDFPTDCWQTNGNQLCPSFGWLVFVFIWGWSYRTAYQDR